MSRRLVAEGLVTRTLLALAALLVLSLLMARPAHAAEFTVTNTNNSGTGSLRQAILDANAASSDDTIKFSIPSTDPNCNDTTDVCTISPTSLLEPITDKVTIDGYTQAGASVNTSPENTNNAVLKIELSGAVAPANADGLAVSGGAGGTEIRGLAINSFGDDGVIVNAPDSVIEGNFIGTDPTGELDRGNGNDGVTILRSGNVVGGPENAAQNVISGNGGNGVKILDTGATNNVVSNNHIGTDADAGEDLGNSESGVLVADAPGNTIGGSSADGTLNIISGNDEHGVEVLGIDANDAKVVGNLIGLDRNGVSSSNVGNTLNGVLVSTTSQVEIGGTAAGQGNTISDNGVHGVEISGSSATNNRVRGNRIGTDKNGNSDHGNGDDGVRITDAPNNTIGGTSAAARNLISGNDDNGVFVSGASNASNNRIAGNFIGTNANGANDVSNGDSGVRVETSGNFVGGTATGAGNVISGNTAVGVFISRADASDNRVEGNLIGTNAAGTDSLGNADGGVALFGSNNTVGGATNEASNRIAFNGGAGVFVIGNPATSNRILRNSIFSNAGPGIDLGGDGATPNDPQDPDAGPNNLQNKPNLTSATFDDSGLTVEGGLNSTPNKTFVVRFFSNPSGENEGKFFVGQKTVTTNANGKATYTFTVVAAPIGTQNVTATATRAGNTSEFSAVRVVQFQ